MQALSCFFVCLFLVVTHFAFLFFKLYICDLYTLIRHLGPSLSHFPVFLRMWNKHWGLLRPYALATPLPLQADVKVSVLSREGEGARISVNTPCTLSHPGAKLLGRQGAESWVLLLSVAPFHGRSVGARVLAGRPSEATSPLSKTYTLLRMPPAPWQPSLAPMPRLGAPSILSSQHTSSTTALWSK